MPVPIKYDNRYSPSPEVLRLLELSRLEVEGMSRKELRCPICGFRIQGMYEDRAGHVEVKCPKCKFVGPLNLAYFRRQKRKACFFIKTSHRHSR